MRHLKLVVDGNVIKYSPAFSVDGLFPGMQEPVHLEFAFSPEWESRVKVAAFYSVMGKEYPPQALKDGKSCVVPAEALKTAAFKVQILGKHNGEKASTTKCTVYLKGGKA